MTAPLPPAPTAPALPGAISWTDPQRAEAFQSWLAGIADAHALRPDTVRLASADASFRRYFRLDSSGPEGTRIVMDAPPDKENSAPFVQVARLMAEAGVHAPRVLEWDQAHGFLLLDDLGRQTMLEVLDPARPDTSRPLYDQAIDALIRWQLSSKPGVLPPYDRALLERELSLFPEWYLGRHRGVAIEGKLKERLERSFKLIVDSNLAAASVYVHRDFMPRNLMVAPGDTLAERAKTPLGVLDFQDAVHGPITYDIACLMRDAFLSWDEEFVLDITVRYWQKARKAGLPVDEDFGAFYRAVEWMGLQRHLKVLGIFCRLKHRDGKPKYSADLPLFFHNVVRVANRHDELKPLIPLIETLTGPLTTTAFSLR